MNARHPPPAPAPPPRITAIQRFGLTTPDVDRLAEFYRQALDCRLMSGRDLRANKVLFWKGINGKAGTPTAKGHLQIAAARSASHPNQHFPKNLDLGVENDTDINSASKSGRRKYPPKLDGRTQ